MRDLGVKMEEIENMPERISDFVFSEHIQKMDFNPLREKTEKWLKRFSFIPFARKNIENKIKEIDELQKRTDNNYSFIEWFFGEMQSQNLCRAKYRISDSFLHPGEDWHSVHINGGGIYEFVINGEPHFSISDDRKEKETRIPVMEGSQEEQLILFGYPIIELPPFGKLHVEYDFETYFNTGGYSDGKPLLFTDNPLDIGGWYGGYMYYGKPGKLFYRADDKLHEELEKSVLPMRARERLNIEAKVYLEEALFFQGNIDCTGTFPFFRWRDKDKPRDAAKSPVPAEGMVLR